MPPPMSFRTSRSDLGKLRHCGTDVRIAETVVIKYPDLVSIGNHVAIDDFCCISTGLEIGDYVHISPLCSIIGGRKSRCVLREFSGLSAGCRLVCGSDEYNGTGLTNPTVPAAYHCELKIAPVTLEKHVILGTNCVVHPGVTVGEGAAVGSCTLITRDLDPWMVYVGVPAKPVRERPRDQIIEMEERLRRELG